VKWAVHYVTGKDKIAIFKCRYYDNAVDMQKDLLSIGYCCWISEVDDDEPDKFDTT